jgi:uncharacterized protein YjiS (DUF1127 family)
MRFTETPVFKAASEMPNVSTNPQAITKPVYCRLLNWFRTRANLAELNGLDSRMLMDIGLNKSEFRAAADPATPFERGVSLHELDRQTEKVRRK